MEEEFETNIDITKENKEDMEEMYGAIPMNLETGVSENEISE